MAGRVVRSPRKHTDSRLKAERGKTDHELAFRKKMTEDEADKVLRRARRKAADVLQTARDRADDQARGRKGSKAARVAIAGQRSAEDDALRREYARAEKVVATERAQRGRLVDALLARERRATDRSLLLERANADEMVVRRDEFLAMVSHDLRNELGAIALYVSQILMSASDDKRGHGVFGLASDIQRANLRMGRLIGDLLDVASIEAGKFTVIPEAGDVYQTVNDIVESFAPIAAAKQISLEVNAADASCSARFDPQRIQQVLGNLLTNALKYSPEGSRVVVEAARKGEEVWLTVADDGPGIAADRLATIFERFSQGGRPDRKGLGLGLYIARKIVEAHGGRIWVESELGSGSTFCVALPLQRTS